MTHPNRSIWLAANILPHEPSLRAWLKRRPVHGLDADDVIQETYALLAGLQSVDHITSPRAYAFHTARSVILRHLRRAKIVQFDALGELELQTVSADEPSPERQTSAREDLRRVAAVIARLPAKCRHAFLLRKLEGLPQREVALRMGISESTVEKHIGRALRTLMDAVKDGGMHIREASLTVEDLDRRVSDAARIAQRN